MSTQINDDATTELRHHIGGDVYVPTDEQYDAARLAWNLMVDQHPALVVMPANSADIATAVRFAAEHGLGVALQSTGHGATRPADDALLINTVNMNRVTIDAEAETAWVEAGARWGQVLDKAQDHGLAPLLGSSPDVGAVGYTLGGGFGWLGRKYGLAADSVRRFEVITADGEALTVSATENPELFWGMRGGGGGLAAVTGMEIQLYPVTQVYGGFLVYPGDMATALLRRWRDWIETVSDEMTSSLRIMNLPDFEFIPEPIRGKTVTMLAGCYCGAVEEGAALIQAWRDWQAPMMDAFRPMPFRDAGQISQDPEEPSPSFSRGFWLKALDDDTIDAFVRYSTLQEGQVPLIGTDFRHAGGAVARADRAATAFGDRDHEILVQFIGIVPAPPLSAALHAYTDRLLAEITPALAGTVYMNFLEGAESAARVREGFPDGKYERLAALKQQYDPGNRFGYGFALA